MPLQGCQSVTLKKCFFSLQCSLELSGEDQRKKQGEFWKVHENTFPMIPKTSTFCQIMPKKNKVEDTYPLKKRKKTQKFVHFKNPYPLLLRLCRPQEVNPELMRHFLVNGPHLMSPQQGLEVSQTHILRAISCYFRTVIMKDPVYTRRIRIHLVKVKFKM